MAYLQLQDIRKEFEGSLVIRGVNLEIQRGEFIVFVGPSGCGKSTLLRLIAGLEDVSSGTLTLDGRDITRVPPGQRDLAMVFQSYALYPHMSVQDNMSFALRLAGAPQDEIRTKVQRAAEALNLSDYLHRKPRELSGGQRQRVAIGRAIVRSPKVFLFDEPLSNLDAALRGNTRVELHQLHKSLGSTTIYVTHDQVEAMTLADRVVVLRGGSIEQVGTPLELYDRPANQFVAQFIGMPPMNLVDARLVPQFATPGRAATLGLRPEDLCITAPGSANAVPAKVELIESLGADTLVYMQARAADGQGQEVPLVARIHGRGSVQAGDAVALQLQPDARVHTFDGAGKAVAA